MARPRERPLFWKRGWRLRTLRDQVKQSHNCRSRSSSWRTMCHRTHHS
jgi:hypothetical protein